MFGILLVRVVFDQNFFCHSSDPQNQLEETIKNLQNQVNSLQKKVIDLENQILVKEGKLNMLPEAPRSDEKASLTSQQGD
jgi:uncharacterized protein YlxW (UPF0749 family)